MTKDFAKPSTTRKPGDKKKPGPSASASTKVKKAKTSSKKASSATLKQSQPQVQSKRTKPIILLIALVSAFSYGLYYLQSIPPTKSLLDTPIRTKTQPESTVLHPEEKPDTRFKFYDLLPESKIKPTEVDVYQFKEKDRQTQYAYLIQTGSFRNKKDAERQKATIAFKGIKVDIKAVKSQNGSTWFRVIAGPYTNRSKMNNALDKLVSINIQPLVKKVKK